MKFLVYGHKGWIGSEIVRIIEAEGHEAVGSTVRADNEEDVDRELATVKPDRVVSLIGRTRGPGYNTIDYLEQKGKLVENMRDNLWAPMVLLLLCKKHGIHYTYMGTGCIFHYDDEHKVDGQGFTEESLPNFFGSGYSTCKGFTDRLMHMHNDDALNIRIRMPITPDHSPYNFITKIVKYQKVINIANSMTVLPELLPIMVKLAAQKQTGTVNLTNPGMTRNTSTFAANHVLPTPPPTPQVPSATTRCLTCTRSTLTPSSSTRTSPPRSRTRFFSAVCLCNFFDSSFFLCAFALVSYTHNARARRPFQQPPGDGRSEEGFP